MIEGQIIFRDDTHCIVRKTSFSDELIDLFDKTNWGEAGALYEHKNTRERLEEIKRPILLEVRRLDDEDLVGCCVLVGRTTSLDDNTYDTYFVRYLVANPKFRGKGLMTKYAIKTMDNVRKGSDPGTLFIGTVEEFNKKSYNLVSAVNYEDVTTINTVSFSRAFPKKDTRVKQIKSASERNQIAALINEQYAGHSLFHQENIFRDGDYYYIEENDEIIAGVQFFRALWVINKLPGWSGKLILNIVPHIPILNRIFNPRKFQFLAFEGIIYKPDRLRDLYRLFEHVLSINKLNTALFWLDEKSPVRQDILSYGKLGILQKMGAASNASIMISFTDVAEDEIQKFRERPTYQSGFDFV